MRENWWQAVVVGVLFGSAVLGALFLRLVRRQLTLSTTIRSGIILFAIVGWTNFIAARGITIYVIGGVAVERPAGAPNNAWFLRDENNQLVRVSRERWKLSKRYYGWSTSGLAGLPLLALILFAAYHAIANGRLHGRCGGPLTLAELAGLDEISGADQWADTADRAVVDQQPSYRSNEAEADRSAE